MYWDELHETMRPAALRDLQLRRLRETLDRVQHVPFYRELLSREGVRPDEIRTLDDLRKLPFTKKQDLRAGYPFGFFAVPMNRVARIHTTSGTTGKPTVVGYTRGDLEKWSDLMARTMTMIGLSADGVFQNVLNMGMFTGGLGYHYGAEKVGMTVVPAGTGNTRRQVEMIDDFGVTAITITPSYAMHLAEVAEEMSSDLSSLRTGIFGAEAWSEATRRELQDRLGLTAYDSYGLSELYGPGVACECPEQDGLHIWHDSYLVEIIDPATGETLGPGERGELVVTPLVKEAMPLIRYRTGDITTLLEDDCPCGRTHPRIERVMGRVDDMLIIRGINVFPSQIEHGLMALPEVGDQFMIHVDRNGHHLDEMTIEVEIKRRFFSGELADLERIREKVVRTLQGALGIRSCVRLVEPGSLPRFEGKGRRVIDRRVL